MTNGKDSKTTELKKVEETRFKSLYMSWLDANVNW
jgi:hypothetical protein